MELDKAPVAESGSRKTSEMSLAFRGDFEGIRHALATIERFVLASSCGRKIWGDMQLALAEALNNIVEHALSGNVSEVIRISCRRTTSGWQCDLRDEGRRMPDWDGPMQQNLPEPRQLPEGGFGRMLICELSSAALYRREQGANHLRLEFSDTG